MMKSIRPIDANALIEWLDKYYDSEKFTVGRFCNMVKDMPTIEARPEQKRGKWIMENIVLTSNPPQYRWHCSECGRMVHWFTSEVLTDFCPNCGARMEGDTE